MPQDIPELARFRSEIADFLDAAVTEQIEECGRKMTSFFPDFDGCMAFHRLLHTRGWSAYTWSKENGGPGWDAEQQRIFDEECRRRDLPFLLPHGIGMVGPAIIHYGTDEQKARYLPGIVSGEDFWCQGYSEPNSGSDLVSLQCRAERNDDHYLINGSKTWTTYAHHANRMFLPVRTSTEGKPQASISFLLLDRMDYPGMDVREIVGLDGLPEQCEVFFENVKVPLNSCLGAENDGWSVAKYLLEHERSGMYSFAALCFRELESIKAMAARTGDGMGGKLVDDPACPLGPPLRLMTTSNEETRQILNDSVGKFLAAEYDFELRRAIVASEDGYSSAHWQQFAELGWLAIPFGEKLGGLGGSALDCLDISRAFGRFLVVEPYLSTCGASASILQHCANNAVAEVLVPSIVAGELIVVLAHTEADARGNGAFVSTRAEITDAGYRIRGAKSLAVHAPLADKLADKLIVTARLAGEVADAGGIGLFLVDGGAEGLAQTPFTTVDGHRAANLQLDVTVPSDALLDDRFAILSDALQAESLMQITEGLGAMAYLLDTTLEYTRVRKQFQRSAKFVGEQRIQLHGGIGMTDELDVGHYAKRLISISAQLGSTRLLLRDVWDRAA